MTVDPSAATCAEPSTRDRGSAGETLGKYRLDRVLGAGGMGIVWAAFDPDLERAVALKLLHSNDVPALRTRLLREARAMARLKHPNVLTVYEVGTDRGRDYIAMEIVEGDTLEGWLATRPPLDDIVEALCAAGRGLVAAHAAGLVHRDFKPHNVLRSHEGHVYVTDFGLARGQIEEGPEVVTAEVPTLDLLSSPLTQTGVMIGTPAYMAPEQFLGRVPDARSDQFAFCITAWEALTGRRPFRGDSLPELQEAASAGVRDLPADDLPAPAREVLARGLDPEPDRRWPDMRALLDAFAAAFARPPAPVRSRRTVVVLAGAAAVALISGGAIYVATRSPPSPPATPKLAAVITESQCTAPEVAFGDAWNDERRAEVIRANPRDDDVIAPLFLLDNLRVQWMSDYRAACDAKPKVRGPRLDCLRSLRDDIARTTHDLTDGDTEVKVVQIVALSGALETCSGARRSANERFGIGVPPVELVVPPAPAPPPPPPSPVAPEDHAERPQPGGDGDDVAR